MNSHFSKGVINTGTHICSLPMTLTICGWITWTEFLLFSNCSQVYVVNWCEPRYSSTSGSAARKRWIANDILSIFYLSFSLARNALVASDFLKTIYAANVPSIWEWHLETKRLKALHFFSEELKRAFSEKIIWSVGQSSQSIIKRQTCYALIKALIYRFDINITSSAH